VDISEDDREYVIKAELPEVKREGARPISSTWRKKACIVRIMCLVV